MAWSARSRCLCLFDVDRTLTAKQGLQAECNLPEGEEEAYDTAFGGGPLLLSLLGQAVGDTPCGPCEKGIVSNGDASGPRERDILAEKLGHQAGLFSHWEEPSSPFVKGCPNGKKQECARRLMDWFERERGAVFSPDQVFFFDDMAVNVNGFEGSGMNAHQISCDSRDGEVGRCGGRAEEISLALGVALCP